MIQVTIRAALAAAPMLVLTRTAGAQGAPGETTGVDMVLIIGVTGIVLTLFGLAAAGLLRWRRARSRVHDTSTPPLITIPHSPGLKPVTPAVPWRQSPSRPAPAVSQGGASHASRPAPAHGGSAPRTPNGGGGSADGELVEGSTIRFYRPPEGTLQLLPGRLEIVAGEDIPHDIRFIRARGEEPEVTFGRSDGPPHRHVQLHARTVSRQHARMRFTDRRWLIENLSETNPVVINGKELDSVDGGYALKEGDRIEMGEVVFLFRER